MNFELQTLFEFQAEINAMQAVCCEMKNPEQRGKAIERVGRLWEIYKTFDKFYYSAHFAHQKILYLQHQLSELQSKALEIKEENERLKKELAWTTEHINEK